MDRLRGVGEDDRRALALVAPFDDARSGLEALFRARAIPGERFMLGDEHVGETVSIEVDEAQVRVVPIDVRKCGKRREARPSAVIRALEISRKRWRIANEV